MENKRPFVHLHVHTEYSLLDGSASIPKLIATAQELGMPAIAMTDHGNMYGTIQFDQACKAKGIKPLIGCEFYTCDDMTVREGRNTDEGNKNCHLVLIAKNYEGYMNLARLNSFSYKDGFYYKPRIDLDLLEKYSKDLICLSGCVAGAIPRLLLKGDYEGAKAYALRLKSMFAEGDFYIEIQNHYIEEELAVLPLLARIAKEIGVKLVATNDVHYIKKSDAEMHDVLLCIGTASYIDTPNRLKFSGDSFYLKDRDEMEEVLGAYPESLETPFEIVEKCNFAFPKRVYQIPSYPCPDNMAPDVYLRKLAYEGLERRYGTITDAIRARAEEELDVIISMGFADYYLIVWDFIFWAKANDIPVGKGRGSGVGSIVAYAIGITDVDPLEYGLIFERFLNKNRTSMPDFDIDICYNRRGEVIEYVKGKYGEHRISQIITFGKLKKKAAIKDVARVYKLPFSDVTAITKEIPDFGGEDKKVHIMDLVNPDSKYCSRDLYERYVNSPEIKKVIDIASQVEGLPRNTSIHAAGVVIYKNAAIDSIPLAKNGNELTTQFNMIEVENSIGLLKMDFLALMTLTDVKMAHDYVLKSYGRDVDFHEIGYKDPEVYNLIAEGNTDAVFQLEGGGMKQFMSQLKPDRMEDIIAGISIYRPGPMDNKDVYIKNRHNPDDIKYLHPKLKPILEVTGGIIVYQEQAMHITRELAGYSMTDADNFRSIISKKKLDKVEIERKKFIFGLDDPKTGEIIIPGCVRNGVPEDIARTIFADIEKFASYAFNKSHAAAYAYLSYETAFYKRYYPKEFMAAVLNNRIDKPDDTKKYMAVLKDMDIKLLPPNINKSEPYFSPEKEGIRYGLACTKNVGTAIMQAVVEERNKNGEFTDLYSFIERMANATGQTPNKRVIESLIKGGAFDCMGMSRATLMNNYERIIVSVDTKRKEKLRKEESGQFDIFDLLGQEFDVKDEEFKYDIVKEYSKRERLLAEKEMLGMYVSGHPLAGYEKEFGEFSFNTSMIPSKKDEDEDYADDHTVKEESPLKDNMEVTTGGIIAAVQKKRTKSGGDMAIVVLEDMYDRIECVLLARTLQNAKQYLEPDTLVRVKGRLSIRDDSYSIFVSELRPWDLVEKEEVEVKDERTLYYNLTDFDVMDEDKIIRIKKILEAHPGPNTVRFQYDGSLHDPGAKIGNLEAVAKELIGILGPMNVKII